MSIVHKSPRGVIHHALAEDVYGGIEDGSVSLVLCDGPYRHKPKIWWDKHDSWDAFRDWYRPHVEAWGRLCAPAASVYVAGSQRSAREIVPLMESRGWAYRSTVVWSKGLQRIAGGRVDVGALRSYFDETEVFDLYQRDTLTPPTGPATTVQYAAGADERNWIRAWLAAEWSATGLRRKDADRAMGTNGMAGHYFGTSQWALPTWERYQQLAAYAAEHGTPRDRPYFVHPDAIAKVDTAWSHPRATDEHLRASFDHLRTEFDHLRTEFDHLREEYEARRVPFNHPVGVGNVWRHPQVSGKERLRGPDGKALHPCQKPLAFYDRMIRASSRPGDLVLEPFGGTCRAAFACEAMTEDDARRYICIEPDLDGRDYLGAVTSLLGNAPQPVTSGLFTES